MYDFSFAIWKCLTVPRCIILCHREQVRGLGKTPSPYWTTACGVFNNFSSTLSPLSHSTIRISETSLGFLEAEAGAETLPTLAIFRGPSGQQRQTRPKVQVGGWLEGLWIQVHGLHGVAKRLFTCFIWPTVFLKARWQAQVNAGSRYIQLCTHYLKNRRCMHLFLLCYKCYRHSASELVLSIHHNIVPQELCGQT